MPLDSAQDLSFLASLQVGFSGAMGGLVRCLRLKETIAESARSILVGAIAAYYMAAVMLPLLNPILKDAGLPYLYRLTFSGFVIGLTGTAILGFYKDLADAKRFLDSTKQKD